LDKNLNDPDLIMAEYENRNKENYEDAMMKRLY